MFFTHGAVSSNQRGLDVAERRIDPLERRRPGGFWAGASDDRRVFASRLGYGGETFEAVGDDLGAALESRTGEPAKRGLAEGVNAPQDDLVRLTVRCCLDRRHKRRLALGAAPGRASALAAEIGVVHLH